MVESVSAYSGLQPFGGSVPVRPDLPDRPTQPDLPPRPGPLERLRDEIRSSDIDTEALASRLTQAFGDDVVGIVSEQGDVDLEALADRIAQERAAAYTEDLSSRYGDDAAGFVSDRGDVDERALQDYLRGLGYDEEYQPRERPSYDTSETTGYNDQANRTYERLPGFINVFA